MNDENLFGQELKARRDLLALSINKLSKLSGVSRRWIVCAEQGSNVTIDVLKKLMQAMKMTCITICPGMTVEAGNAFQDTASLATAVEEITRSTALARQAADRIRTFTLGSANPPAKGSTGDEGFNERAAALVTHFAEHVRSLSDPDKLQRVEIAVSNFLRPEEDAPVAVKPTQPRRAKRA